MSWMAIMSGNMLNNIFDAFVKNPSCPVSVVPASAGIQECLAVMASRCSLSRTQRGAEVTGL
jgi:hypothetical protein